MILQVALSVSLAQSLQARPSSSRRQLHTALIVYPPISRHYPMQPLTCLTSRFILLLTCHRMKNTYSSSMSLTACLRHHRMLWLAFPFPLTAANPQALRVFLRRLLRLLIQRLLRLLLQRLLQPRPLLPRLLHPRLLLPRLLQHRRLLLRRLFQHRLLHPLQHLQLSQTVVSLALLRGY